MIALLNLSVLGFSFVVFHNKAKRTQQGNLLTLTHLHNWDELVLDPGVVVDQTDHRLAVDCCVEGIRELSS